MTFRVFSRDGCDYCVKACELLRRKGHPYEEIKGVSVLQLAASTYPLIFYGDRRIGGYTQLEETLEEPILSFSDNRFVFESPQLAWVQDYLEKAEGSFWITKEIPLHDDVRQWPQLDEPTKHFVLHVLAFFAAADGLVAESLAERYMVVQDPAVRAFLAYQQYNESVHSETYALILKTLVASPAERDNVLNHVTQQPHIKAKTEWSKRWLGYTASYAEKTVAYACVELIFFSSSFCSIFHLKRRGVLPGVTFSNDLIARDEGLHGDFACHLYHQLTRKLPAHRVLQIVLEATDIECDFVSGVLKPELIGLNAQLITSTSATWRIASWCNSGYPSTSTSVPLPRPM